LPPSLVVLYECRRTVDKTTAAYFRLRTRAFAESGGTNSYPQQNSFPFRFLHVSLSYYCREISECLFFLTIISALISCIQLHPLFFLSLGVSFFLFSRLYKRRAQSGGCVVDWGKTTEASGLRIAGQSAPSSQHCLIHFYWELRFGEASVLERLVRVRKSRLISLLQNPHPCDSLFPLLPLLFLLRQYLLSGRHSFPLDKYGIILSFSFLFFFSFFPFSLSLSLWKFGLRVFYLPFFLSFFDFSHFWAFSHPLRVEEVF